MMVSQVGQGVCARGAPNHRGAVDLGTWLIWVGEVPKSCHSWALLNESGRQQDPHMNLHCTPPSFSHSLSHLISFLLFPSDASPAKRQAAMKADKKPTAAAATAATATLSLTEVGCWEGGLDQKVWKGHGC